MKPTAAFLLPPKDVSSCIAGAIVRDSRKVDLADTDRFNYFPATPMVSVTCVMTGELRLVALGDGLEVAKAAQPLPNIFVSMPSEQPTVSWSTGPVYAITIAFYPDSWRKIGALTSENCVPAMMTDLLYSFNENSEIEVSWATFCNAFLPIWRDKRNEQGLPDWHGSDKVSDWSHHLFSRIAMTTAGRSIRTFERRLKYWTFKTRQSLDHYAAVEKIHRQIVENPGRSLADLADSAGYSDQSHMGRAIVRATGFSPAKLNKLIETEESFWCYRLLGERF